MKALSNLLSDEFELKFAFIDSVKLLRMGLSRAEEIVALRRSIGSGSIAVEDVRLFTESLMRHLRIGERFVYDTALCAIAVALETLPGEFADEFLESLATVRAAELRRPSSAARECLLARKTMAKNQAKEVVLVVPMEHWLDCVPGAQGGSGDVRTVRWRRPKDCAID